MALKVVRIPGHPMEGPYSVSERPHFGLDGPHVRIASRHTPCEGPHFRIASRHTPCEGPHVRIASRHTPCQGPHVGIASRYTPCEGPHVRIVNRHTGRLHIMTSVLRFPFFFHPWVPCLLINFILFVISLDVFKMISNLDYIYIAIMILIVKNYVVMIE